RWNLVGRLGPHVVACWLWGIVWIVALTLLGDYRFLGSIWAVAAGLGLLSLATIGVALFLIVVTREVATALSAAVIVAGSALAYSGASLPIDGAAWFARVWSAVLPLTHYIRFEMDVMIGAHTRPLLVEAGAMLLYPVLAGGAGLWLFGRSAHAR
uniref:ABC transporter permease n=1 Tax=uncultured Sphingomonas sp. TaxID=158754 RepID=UPI0025D7A08A